MIDDSCFPQDFAGVLLIRGLARYFDDAREHAFSQLFIFNPVLFHVVVPVVVGRGRREVVLVSIQGAGARGAAHSFSSFGSRARVPRRRRARLQLMMAMQFLVSLKIRRGEPYAADIDGIRPGSNSI